MICPYSLMLFTQTCVRIHTHVYIIYIYTSLLTHTHIHTSIHIYKRYICKHIYIYVCVSRTSYRSMVLYMHSQLIVAYTDTYINTNTICTLYTYIRPRIYTQSPFLYVAPALYVYRHSMHTRIHVYINIFHKSTGGGADACGILYAFAYAFADMTCVVSDLSIGTPSTVCTHCATAWGSSPLLYSSSPAGHAD